MRLYVKMGAIDVRSPLCITRPPSCLYTPMYVQVHHGLFVSVVIWMVVRRRLLMRDLSGTPEV
jgi:hypothetical protein